MQKKKNLGKPVKQKTQNYTSIEEHAQPYFLPSLFSGVENIWPLRIFFESQMSTNGRWGFFLVEQSIIV